MPHQSDWRALYPFVSHFMQLGPLRYHYLDEGQGDVLLMVHGNPTWSFYWRNLFTAFRQRHRIVAVDHIGCGLSDKPSDYPYSLAQHTANLVQLIDHLRLDNMTLLGHDWGGAIGLGAAVQRPNQFSRLVLFNTGAFPPPRVPRRIAVCRTPVLGRVALQGLNLFARLAPRMATSKPRRLTSAVRAGLLAPYDSWSHRVGIQRFVRDIPLTRRHPTYTTLRKLEQQLPNLRSRPMQLIWGMQDWCFDEVCLDRFTNIFPDAEVHRLQDAGHWVVEDAHEQIVPMLQSFFVLHPIHRGGQADQPLEPSPGGTQSCDD